MEEKKSANRAFSEFSKKFSRFKKSSEGKKNPDFQKKETLQNLIAENEERKKENVLASLKNYEIPFTKEIEDDEASLLKSYSLFKGVLELNKSIGNEKTYICDFKIASPLAKKTSYTYGTQFVYLQCWFKYCKKIDDFMPVLEKSLESKCDKFNLTFIPSDEFEFEARQKELVQVIEESIFS